MRFTSAGELVEVETEVPWVSRLIEDTAGAGGDQVDAPPEEPPQQPTVRLRVEARRAPFPRDGLRPVAPGAYSDETRTLLVNACGSGFDLLITLAGPAVGDPDRGLLEVTARYRPRVRSRAANVVSSKRFRLLAGRVLAHYPVLWRASWRGRVPLHATVVRTDAGTPLIAGPPGVGRSTVLAAMLATGATATTDQLCGADRSRCFGLAGPWQPTARRAPVLVPDRVVVLERGAESEVSVVDEYDAARVLVAGTYAADELGHYWAFAANLAVATGRGPAHPPIAEIGRRYAERLPCLRLCIGEGDTVSAVRLLN
jgi:hypothetical protein